MSATVVRKRSGALIACGVMLLAPAAARAAQHLGQRTLKEGMSGHDVRVLQDFLTRAGYRTGIDGVFGPGTKREVVLFERAHHMTADGVVGAGVVSALRSAVAARSAKHTESRSRRSSTSAWHLGDRVLKPGMSGHDVRVLQDFLTRAGFPTPVVGKFGPTTEANVKRFESRHHLSADGIVGPEVVAALRQAITGGGGSSSGPVGRARVLSDGMAVAPAGAPATIRALIAAGNRIAKKPYRYGGGHGSWTDSGYDCSGSVSYALHYAGLLRSSLDSTGFESYGRSGHGHWISIYANSGHAYMVVAGLRFDTSGATASGSRWQSAGRSGSGYVVRHPSGW